jgi:hypothetical protein
MNIQSSTRSIARLQKSRNLLPSSDYSYSPEWIVVQVLGVCWLVSLVVCDGLLPANLRYEKQQKTSQPASQPASKRVSEWASQSSDSSKLVSPTQLSGRRSRRRRCRWCSLYISFYLWPTTRTRNNFFHSIFPVKVIICMAQQGIPYTITCSASYCTGYVWIYWQWDCRNWCSYAYDSRMISFDFLDINLNK